MFWNRCRYLSPTGPVLAAILLAGPACASEGYAPVRAPGRPLALAKCGSCHPVPGAHRLDADEARIVMRFHQKRLRLSPRDRELLFDYLQKRGNGTQQVGPTDQKE